MESRIKIFGHPAHQLLVPFPIGAFGLSAIMDTSYALSHQRQHARTARQALDFGLITGAVALPFGLVDLLAIPPKTRAKRIGVAHALGNIVMLGLFATSRVLRHSNETSAVARWLSGSAFALSGITAWLGGELVVRHAIGVSGNTQGGPKPLVDAAEVPSLSEAPKLPSEMAQQTLFVEPAHDEVFDSPGSKVKDSEDAADQPSIVDWGTRN